MKCPNCGVEMKIINETDKQIFMGKATLLEYNVFVCPKCKNSFIDLESLQNAWKKIRNESGIPAPEEFKRAREALGLTGEELAKIMGKTKSLISKLENGARRPSDKIFKFYKEYVFPGKKAFFKALKEAFHQNRISENEYVNIKDKIQEKPDNNINTHTVDKKIEIIKTEYGFKPSEYNGNKLFSKKSFRIVRMILKIKKSLDKMTLFKLLFYVDSEYFEHNGKSLTGLRYIHNLYGPTPFDYDLLLSLLKDAKILKEDGEKYIPAENNDPIDDLDIDTKEFILKVLQKYDYDAIELSNMSHQEPFWRKTKKIKLLSFAAE